MGALSNKGGRGHKNREEIGAGAIFNFLAASPLVLARFAREFRGPRPAASPLVRPARQNRDATQAIKLTLTLTLTLTLGVTLTLVLATPCFSFALN